MDELKPCPFCGNVPYVVEHYSIGNHYPLNECDIKSPIITVGCERCGITSSYAPEFWNHRPAEEALKAEVEKLKAENDELRYIVKQFEEWRGDDDTGCPKYQHPAYPCAGEKQFKNDFGANAVFDRLECEIWGEGCWVEYYRWKYRNKNNAPATVEKGGSNDTSGN